MNSLSTTLNFSIPLNRSDLQSKSGIDEYAVRDILPKRILIAKLQEYGTCLRSKGYASIIPFFDTFYSVIHYFNEIDLALKEKSWEMLIKGCRTLVSDFETILERENFSDVRMECLTSMKMTVYLLCQFMGIFETDSVEPSSLVVASKGRRRKATESDDNINWHVERDKGLQCLLNIIRLNLQPLWTPPIAEENFVSLVSNICYKMLENLHITRETSTKDIIFHVIGTLIKRYTHALSCSMTIIQLLQHFEHLASPLAKACHIFVEQYNNTTVITNVIREIGQTDNKDLIRDTSGSRSYATFLVEVATLMPGVVNSNMMLLINMLSKESYLMRNCILSVIAEIIAREMSVDGLDDKTKDLRNQYFDLLEDHIHDVNAFVRSKCLQIWLRLVNEKSLLLNRQTTLLELVIGRLMDKSSNVRKNAVILLSALLKNNPFAPQITTGDMKNAYETELQKLEDLEKELVKNNDALTEVAEERWKALDAELVIVINEILASENTNEEESKEEKLLRHNQLLSEDTPQRICERILEALTGRDFKTAINLLIAARSVHGKVEHFIYKEETNRPVLSDSDIDSGTEDDELTEAQQLIGCLKRLFFGVQNTGQDEEEQPSVEGSQANTRDKQEELNQSIIQQQILVRFLKESSVFASHVTKAMPTVCQLLGSKTVSDVLEAIQFFVTCFQFGLPGSMLGIQQMLPLIWSREANIKDAVIQAYRKLYLDINEGQTDVQHAQTVSNNLIALTATSGASLDYLTSLEELVNICTESGEICPTVIQTLWKRFTLKITNTTTEESHAALKLLVMAATNSPDIVQSNINIVISEGLGVRAESDMYLAKESCIMLSKLSDDEKNKGPHSSSAAPFKLSMDHEIFERIKYLLISCAKDDLEGWIPFCEAAVTLTYKIAEHPDIICSDVLRQILSHVLESSRSEEKLEDKIVADEEQERENNTPSLSSISSVKSSLLANLMHLLGEIALRQLVHLDVAICKELKRRQTQQNARKKKKQNKKQRNNLGDISKKDVDADDEMLGTTTADDSEVEYIRNITENCLVTGPNLLAACSHLVVTICTDKRQFPDAHLQTSACLALSKFMLVSSKFCENNLQLLFTILDRSPHEVIRSNTIITTGDLMFRFPNLMVPWTPNLYASLRDSSRQVRKNTIMVLTHLILNDMVKVKGQISELAVCIVDEDELIASRAHLFFNELGKKGNAVYNIMPDVISRLSDTECGVKEADFKVIMKHLFTFIQKERQSESLVEKLCHRFRATINERQWRDLSFCLSLLTYSDRSLKKLQENFSCFNDKLYEEEVYNSFCAIMASAKKFAKPESRILVEELEERLKTCHEKGVDDDQAVQKANHAKKKKTSGKKQSSRSQHLSSNRSFQESDEDFKSSPDSVNVKINTRKSMRTFKKPLVFSSDEDDDVESSKDLSDDDIENINPKQTGIQKRNKPRQSPSTKDTSSSKSTPNRSTSSRSTLRRNVRRV